MNNKSNKQPGVSEGGGTPLKGGVPPHPLDKQKTRPFQWPLH